MPYTRFAIRTIILVFGAAMTSAAQTAPAQDQPDALDLLKNVELAYGAMNTYSAKVTNTMAMNGSEAQGKMNMETSTTIIADASGKFRMESQGMIGMTMVYDGSTMWLYMPAANSYSKIPLSNQTSYVNFRGGSGMFGGANAMQEYRGVTAAVKDAKIVRSEKLHVNDSDVDCWVVSLEYESPGNEESAAMQARGLTIGDSARNRMLWVDKSRYLIYQDESTAKMTMPNTNAPTNIKQTSKVESVTVNEAVSPDAFTFTPPPGAKEMDESKSMPKATEGPQSKD